MNLKYLWFFFLLAGCSSAEDPSPNMTHGTTPQETCQNGKVDKDEVCEGKELKGKTCESEGFTGGTLLCSDKCELDTAQCYKCGDEIKNGEEECDGADLGENLSCQGIGEYTGGPLKCSSDCSFDLSECTKACDGKLDEGEVCDGEELGGETCESQGYAGGTLACDRCAFDTSQCFKCGDGAINKGEECDTQNFGGSSCSDKGFDEGELKCNDKCKIDTTACFKCGDGIKNGSEECDGGDLDGKTSCKGIDNNNGGRLKCKNDCTFDTSECVTTCGNTLDAGEECDGAKFAKACADFAFQGGKNVCSDCVLDLSQCFTCGDGILGAEEKCDASAANQKINPKYQCDSSAIPNNYSPGPGFRGELTCTEQCRLTVLSCESSKTYTKLSAGGEHVCVFETGKPRCWGLNNRRQSDAAKAGMGAFKDINAGYRRTCVIGSDDQLRCWGNKLSNWKSNTIAGYQDLSVGDIWCATTENSKVRCWNIAQHTVFEKWDHVNVKVGKQLVCAYQKNVTKIDCWDLKGRGLLKDKGLEGKNFDVGSQFICLLKNGSISCETTKTNPPLTLSNIPSGSNFTEIAAGDNHACAIKTNKEVQCWGENKYGQSDVPLNLKATEISAGDNFTCALVFGGGIKCWGKGAKNIIPPIP